MIKWKQKFSEQIWEKTSNPVLILGLLDSTAYDPTAVPKLLILDSFGVPDPVLSTGWDSKYETILSTPERKIFDRIPGLSGKYDKSKNYPLAFVRLGEATNGEYRELDSLLIPIRKVVCWAEIDKQVMDSLDWIQLDWSKSHAENPCDFYPEHRKNGAWIGKTDNGDIVLNLEDDENGEQWYYSSESNLARVYGIESHTKYDNNRLTSVAFVEYDQSQAERVSFVA